MNDQNEIYGQEQPDVKPADFLETPEYKSAEYGEQQAQPQSTPASQTEESNEIIHRLSQKGYDVSSFQNDEQLIAETEARYAAAQQAASQSQQMPQEPYPQEPYPQDVPDFTQPEESGPSKPEFDPSWTNLVEPDSSGRYVVRDEYIGSVDPGIAEKVNEYVEWRQERSNKLIDDPVNALMESGLSEQIDAQIRNAVSSEINRGKVQADAQKFISQNADYLYVKDPNTGNFQSDASGQPILSAAGQALNNAHITLRQQGMYDPVARHQVAMQMVQNQMTQAQLEGIRQQQQQQYSAADAYKQQYTDQPFAQPTNPLPPGYMPNTPVQPTANALGANGLPEHNSLGSLATALAVHKGFLQPKG